VLLIKLINGASYQVNMQTGEVYYYGNKITEPNLLDLVLKKAGYGRAPKSQAPTMGGGLLQGLK